MGDFRITVDAIGGHGCQRQAKDGEQLRANCGQPGCPDCAARRFVSELRLGNNVQAATLEHWPASMRQQDGSLVPRAGGHAGPIDDLLTHVRHGSFTS